MLGISISIFKYLKHVVQNENENFCIIFKCILSLLIQKTNAIFSTFQNINIINVPIPAIMIRFKSI